MVLYVEASEASGGGVALKSSSGPSSPTGRPLFSALQPSPPISEPIVWRRSPARGLHDEDRPSRRALPALSSDPTERASAIAARSSLHNEHLARLHARHLARAADATLLDETSLLIEAVGSLTFVGRSDRLLTPSVGTSSPAVVTPKPPSMPPPPRGLPAGRPLRVLAELNGVPLRLHKPASEFDERHSERTRRAVAGFDTEPPGAGDALGFTRRLRAIQRNKFVEPIELARVERIAAKERKVEVKEWRLEESVWKKRAGWADSGSFLDTDEAYERAFNIDWSMALRAHGLAHYIRTHDDGESDDEADEDGDGVADDELVEVGGVLWRHHALIYRAFDAYASMGGGDVSRVSQGAFKSFCADCRLATKGSASCGQAHIDQMFMLVNQPERQSKAASATGASTAAKEGAARGGAGSRASRGSASGGSASGGSTGTGSADGGSTAASPSPPGTVGSSRVPSPSPPTLVARAMPSPPRALGGVRGSAADVVVEDTHRRALNRMEWLQCLVRLAIMRYVIPGTIPDVSSALEALFASDIETALRGAALQDSNAFRLEACYTEATDAALLARAASVRALFNVYARIDGADVTRRGLAKLLSSAEWMQLLRDLDWIDDEFTLREASLAFAWARMRVVDEHAPASRQKLDNLCFEDFLDAFVRVATMKALPADDELADDAGGLADAGAFLLALRHTPEQHKQWVLQRARSFDKPLGQPIERAVTHLLSLAVRSVQAVTLRHVGSRQKASRADAPPDVSEADIQRFRNFGGLKALDRGDF